MGGDIMFVGTRNLTLDAQFFCESETSLEYQTCFKKEKVRTEQENRIVRTQETVRTQPNPTNHRHSLPLFVEPFGYLLYYSVALN